MEPTTNEYYDSTGFVGAEPCNRDSDNILGAQLSILYYFMFVFNLIGNGIVLIIIYRWVVQQNFMVVLITDLSCSVICIHISCYLQ